MLKVCNKDTKTSDAGLLLTINIFTTTFEAVI